MQNAVVSWCLFVLTSFHWCLRLKSFPPPEDEPPEDDPPEDELLECSFLGIVTLYVFR